MCKDKFLPKILIVVINDRECIKLLFGLLCMHSRVQKDSQVFLL